MKWRKDSVFGKMDFNNFCAIEISHQQNTNSTKKLFVYHFEKKIQKNFFHFV